MSANKTPWRAVLSDLFRGRAPAQLIIQYTDRCNALCAQCGMNARADLVRSTLSADEAVRLVDAAAERGVRALSFTGGEPLLFLGEIVELSRRAKARGIPLVRTGTNGFVFRGHEHPDFPTRMQRLAETLAESGLDNFWISLDSADPAVHEANRGLPGVVKGLEKGLKVLRGFGLYPAANLGLNRLVGGTPPPAGAFDPEGFLEHFRRAFRRFYAFAESLGFTTVNACYPMSLPAGEARDKAVYAATSEADFIRFEPCEKPLLYRALAEAAAAFRHRLRVFTPQSALLALIREHETGRAAYPCRGGADYFFVQAGSGLTAYPCGYRGSEPLGPFPDLDRAALKRAECTACDWECFRDPSVLFGPLLALRRNPLAAVAGLLRDRAFVRTWLTDLRYARACDYFSFRIAPDAFRLARFAPLRPPGAGQAPRVAPAS